MPNRHPDDLAPVARTAFAEKVCAAAGIVDARIKHAFASVPRHEFMGAGPWYVYRFVPQFPFFDYSRVDDAEAAIFDDVALALDPDCYVNTGLPSVIAKWIAAADPYEGERVLQVGAGTGYYTAILARLVGTAGRVVAVEVRPDFAERAANLLQSVTQVEVHTADGGYFDPGEVDIILVHAGVTDLPPIWLSRLASGGRLLVPLTFVDERLPGIGFGVAFRFQRLSDTAFSADFLGMPYITTSTSLRDPAGEEAVRGAMEDGQWTEVKLLRTDRHEREPGCWLHREGWCLSRNTSLLPCRAPAA